MPKPNNNHPHKSKIACWQFIENKNYGGWNICFDDAGGKELLKLLHSVENSRWPKKEAVQLIDPLEIGQEWIKDTGLYRIAETLIISNRKDSSDLWKLELKENCLTVLLGSDTLAEFKSAIENNLFDGAIGLETSSSNLHFW